VRTRASSADENGNPGVRIGERRTIASVEAGNALVAAVIIIGNEYFDNVVRAVSQLHESEYRSGLGIKDKLAAVEQLLLFGLKGSQIVKQSRLASRTSSGHWPLPSVTWPRAWPSGTNS
jgi:hypothetical protein